MIGSIVSHYKILKKLGEGGMGVVYKAHDSKLDRDVALKFLPPELTLDSEAKDRFFREAKTASALDHNNICNVHEIGETDDGQFFIVMAHYEGETLKSRIARGPLRFEEATDLAIQMAQGLSEAHQHGIVHRDVKPANVLITKGGVAKIVDFGLAKLSSRTKLTRTGSTLGTVAYMSPEQLQGKDVDARADIFSFGVVFYEMLTGMAPFRGDHEAALMYSIMNEEPGSLQTHIPEVPSELIHIVGRALEKDPASRYKTMDDVLIDLRRLRRETSAVSVSAIGRKRGIRSRQIIITGSTIIVVSGILLLPLFQSREPPRLNANVKISIVSVPVNGLTYCGLSHDGNWIAFGGEDERQKWDIYFMHLSGGLVRRITFDSSRGVFVNDISRDGANVLYRRFDGTRYEMAVVPSLGGRTHAIYRGIGLSGRFAPTSDNVLVQRGGYGDTGRCQIISKRIDGSDLGIVFEDVGHTHEAGNISSSFSVSPNGRSIAWIRTFADFSQDIITHDLETGKEVQVTFSRTPKDEVFWTHDNYLLYSAYANGNYDLWICPAEGGAALQVTNSRLDETQAAMNDAGSKLIYLEANIAGNVKMMDLVSGKVRSITSDDQNRQGACVSPDQRYVAFTRVPSYVPGYTHSGIQIVDTKGEDPVRTICPAERIVGKKAWSPDGKWIAYSRPPDSIRGTIKICLVSPFGASRSQVVAEVDGRPPDRNLVLTWLNRDTLSWFFDMKTWVCPITGSKPVQFYQDSTRAYLFRDRGYVAFVDYRVGRRGWWVDIVPELTKPGKNLSRKISSSISAVIAPDGQFLLEASDTRELQRISLPDGKSTSLHHIWPTRATFSSITQDGASVIYIESVSNSKLMLWENPFVKE